MSARLTIKGAKTRLRRGVPARNTARETFGGDLGAGTGARRRRRRNAVSNGGNGRGEAVGNGRGEREGAVDSAHGRKRNDCRRAASPLPRCRALSEKAALASCTRVSARACVRDSRRLWCSTCAPLGVVCHSAPCAGTGGLAARGDASASGAPRRIGSWAAAWRRAACCSATWFACGGALPLGAVYVKSKSIYEGTLGSTAIDASFLFGGNDS
ncbi:hypothetical protein FGB62_127g042 [Gracilaria domingensis]|nr:hypothetical protein FGB62_127g042 [Gracilaria domingensis]